MRLTTGEYTLRFAGSATHDALLVHRTDTGGALALRPLGAGLNPLPALNDVTSEVSDEVLAVTLSGDAGWAEVTLRLEVYPYQPGLLRTRLTATLHDPPPDGPALEWTFVDPATGEVTKAGFTVYADPAPMCAPVIYGYAEILDSTLFYAVDRTALNPFMQAAHYTPSATPGRQGRSFGHTIDAANLRALPAGEPFVLYDSYLYLTPGKPDGEAGMFARYLRDLGDVYDLLHKPVNGPVLSKVEGTLPDWRALAEKTIADLSDERVWVTLESKRYLRAYVDDTRQSAELISQLDVLEGIVRYEARYDDTTTLDEDLWAALPDFYDKGYGMLVNSGPVSLGRQTRGDTWYELGHAVKMAELGLMGYEQAAQLALDSAAAWMDFAHAVDYEFPQFYNFDTWRGTGREPDCAGGYAYYMLLLHDLTGDTIYLDEARTAIEHLAGHGFRLAYETHITAQAVAACARLADLTGDTKYLQLSFAPLANLMRLTWLWECDYGSATGYRTFFGLSPMARSAVITPKEQYEAWLYLREYLTLAHGQIDPAIEGLVAEFLEHTLTTLLYTLPPLLPTGVATDNPTTYPTVAENVLELYIPLEDLRDGWSLSGVIGQEVYGAGMAPTLAAVAYQEVAPGVVAYSGPPVVEAIEDGDMVLVTFSGMAGRSTPVQVFGVATVEGAETRACGAGLCFQAESGTVYRLRR